MGGVDLDYLAFKQARRNDLLHYGVKRRSGRYPWGSGEHPYQSDAKRAIDKAVRRTDKRNDPKNIALQGTVKNRIASNVKNSHNMFGEKSEEIRKRKDDLNRMIYESETVSRSEMKKAIKDPKLREEVDQYIQMNEKFFEEYKLDPKQNRNNSFRDFAYDVLLNENDMMDKWFPETKKLLKEIDKSQEEYKNIIKGEVSRILSDTKGISSERISRVKNEYITYGDIVDQILKRRTTTNFAQFAEGNVLDVIYDELSRMYK